MTLKQLEAFYWAAKLGSFAIAAARLHITQSSLSKRIAELEESVSCALFDRSHKHALPTEAGQRLLVVAQEMLDLRDRARSEVIRGESLRGTCQFGVSELGALTWLPKFVARVRLDHPGLVLHPSVDLSLQLAKRVARGELDFAVGIGTWLEASEIVSEPLVKVQYSWMASPTRVGAGALLDRRAFEQHPVITMTKDSALTRAFEIWAAAQRLEVQRILACDSFMAIAGLVVSGIGISFFPTQFMRPWVERGLLVDLRSDPPLPDLEYCFLARQDDSRDLVRRIKRYVIEEVDLSRDTNPFRDL
jgi:DNA-binding transcriptional LysR family regulator